MKYMIKVLNTLRRRRSSGRDRHATRGSQEIEFNRKPAHRMGKSGLFQFADRRGGAEGSDNAIGSPFDQHKSAGYFIRKDGNERFA